MKRLVQLLVARTKSEEIFVQLRRRMSFVRRFIPVGLRHKFTSIGKFVPHSTAYPPEDSYSLTRDNTNFIINRSDYVQWRIFYGVRDNALAEAKRRLKDSATILDIGANVGAFSLRLAQFALEKQLTDVHIHAFEPNPSVASSYARNLNLNPDLHPFIHLHHFGLGAKDGELAFCFDNTNTGAGRVVTIGQKNQHPIRVKKLDDFINELNPRDIAFIKLIVEGFEPEVLKGGWNTIQKFKPVLFMEVTPAWWAEHGHNVDDVLAKLKMLGYTFSIEHYNEMLPYDPSLYTARTQFNLLGYVR